MQIPASRLLDYLQPGVSFVLRGAKLGDGSCPLLQSELPYTDAVARTVRGEVEGIATPAGKIKYLRELPESERTPAPEREAADVDKGSNAFAKIPIGVYRQKLRQAIVGLTNVDKRVVVDEGEVSGFCYAFHGLDL